MNKTRKSQRRCPQCGWAITRIPRRPEDRIASQTPPIRRYRCCEAGGCGWEGTLAATWADTGVERCRDPELVRVRMLRAPKSRFVSWAVIGLAAVALGGGGVKLYAAFAPTSLLAKNARAIPFGVSDFGRPLPENHPFLQQDVDAPARAVTTAASATASSPAATPGPAPVTNPAASSEGAPLSLREDCVWGEPGRNPYKGTVQQALTAARLPAQVVALLERKIRERERSDRLEIRNDKIRGVHSNAAFESRGIKLTYGKTLCLNSRVNFNPGHVERADLYEVADARGIMYSVMVPDVCGNVSVLGPRAQSDPKPQDILAWYAEQPLPRGPEGFQNLVRITGETNSVPEPESWTLMLGGLALLAWFTRRRERGSRRR